MVLGVSRYPIFLGRRKEKIVGLYPIYFVVTQALQHTEHANQLKVGETNFFANSRRAAASSVSSGSTSPFGRTNWGKSASRARASSRARARYALVLLSQHNTASSDPFLTAGTRRYRCIITMCSAIPAVVPNFWESRNFEKASGSRVLPRCSKNFCRTRKGPTKSGKFTNP